MVFIVTSGSYDDYTIHGAFTRMGDARKCYGMIEDGCIEIWEGENNVAILPRPRTNPNMTSEIIESPRESVMTGLYDNFIWRG